jgi:hypothetical protein
LIILALVLLMSAESQAILFGVRLSNVGERPLPIGDDGGSKGRFGIYLGTQENSSIFLIGADYDRYKENRGDSLLYARRLTVNIGYRYQLLPAGQSAAMNFLPWVSFHVFKSFSKVKADSAIISPANVTYLKDIANDEGAWLGVGAEYFLAKVFSLGAEAGIRYSRANSKAFGYDIKIRQYNTFAALLLTFYWQSGRGAIQLPGQ